MHNGTKIPQKIGVKLKVFYLQQFPNPFQPLHKYKIAITEPAATNQARMELPVRYFGKVRFEVVSVRPWFESFKTTMILIFYTYT